MDWIPKCGIVFRNSRQTKVQNSDLTGNWYQEEIKQAAALNNNTGSVPELAGRANQLAEILQQFHDNLRHAAFWLGNLGENAR